MGSASVAVGAVTSVTSTRIYDGFQAASDRRASLYSRSLMANHWRASSTRSRAPTAATSIQNESGLS